jgi:hypothetical protein
MSMSRAGATLLTTENLDGREARTRRPGRAIYL